MCAAVNAFSASACSASAALTSAASSWPRASSAGRSSGDALPTCLLTRLVLGAQVVGGGDRGPAGRVGFEQRINQCRVLTAGALRCAHHVRAFAQQA